MERIFDSLANFNNYYQTSKEARERQTREMNFDREILKDFSDNENDFLSENPDLMSIILTSGSSLSEKEKELKEKKRLEKVLLDERDTLEKVVVEKNNKLLQLKEKKTHELSLKSKEKQVGESDLDKLRAEINEIGNLSLLLSEKMREKSDKLILRGSMKNHDISVQAAIDMIEKKLIFSQKVDLCFIIDATVSIDWLKITKNKIEEIVKMTKESFKYVKLNLAIVVYRDLNQKEKNIELLQFTENVVKFQNFLEEVVPLCGKDASEDVNGGFQQALKLNWSNITRLVIHMGDAPCHGSRFHSTKENPENAELSKIHDRPWEDIFGEMKRKGIDYYAFQIVEKNTKQMFTIFEEIWNNIKLGSDRRNPKFQLKSLQDDSNTFIMQIFGSIKQSISQNLGQLLITTTQSLLNYKLQNTIQPIPIYQRNDPQNPGSEITGKFLKISPRDLTSEFQVEEFKILTGENKKIGIKKYPFACGSFNYAFESWIPETQINLVAKQPKIPSEISIPLLKKELKKNSIAVYLSKLFNEKIEQLGNFNWAKILFIQTVLFVSDKNEYYLLEGEIEGKFQKYSNNLDSIDDTEEIRHLTAFAHFSYQVTKGTYLITDFQGVNRCLLTDPCLHSKTGEFRESGDFDYQGFIYFFKKHKCNDLCYKLGLNVPEDLDLLNKKLVQLEPWKETPFAHTNESFKLCRNIFCNKVYVEDDEFCTSCQNYADIVMRRDCSSKYCTNSFTYKPYHYEFSAITSPRKCRDCRGQRALENL